MLGRTQRSIAAYNDDARAARLADRRRVGERRQRRVGVAADGDDLRGGRPRRRRDRRPPSATSRRAPSARCAWSRPRARPCRTPRPPRPAAPTARARPPRPPSRRARSPARASARPQQATDAIRDVADSSAEVAGAIEDLSARSEQDRRDRRHDHRHRRADEPAGAERGDRGRARRRAGPRLRRRRRRGPQAGRGVPERRRPDLGPDRRDPDRDAEGRRRRRRGRPSHRGRRRHGRAGPRGVRADRQPPSRRSEPGWPRSPPPSSRSRPTPRAPRAASPTSPRSPSSPRPRPSRSRPRRSRRAPPRRRSPPPRRSWRAPPSSSSCSSRASASTQPGAAVARLPCDGQAVRAQTPLEVLAQDRQALADRARASPHQHESSRAPQPNSRPQDSQVWVSMPACTITTRLDASRYLRRVGSECERASRCRPALTARSWITAVLLRPRTCVSAWVA